MLDRLKGIPPTAEWLEEIRGAIDGADVFVFIISPDSCASEVCQTEVAHAVERHKRLIPLHYRDTPRDAIPPEIAELHVSKVSSKQTRVAPLVGFHGALALSASDAYVAVGSRSGYAVLDVRTGTTRRLDPPGLRAHRPALPLMATCLLTRSPNRLR